MKTRTHLFIVLAVLAIGRITHAATVTWTNTAGGNWSDVTSWSPNQTPGASDTAVITNAGNYSVTLDTSPTVDSLILGATGGSGTQNFFINSQNLTVNDQFTINSGSAFDLDSGSLTLNGQLNVKPQGQFNLDGGYLLGTCLLAGTITWTSGSIASITTIATNGLLVVTGPGNGNHDFFFTLTNAGTIQVTNQAYLRCYLAQLVNLTNGLVDIQDDSYIYDATGDPSEEVVNQGTIRKSGGTNTSYIYPTFYNSGTLDVQSGTVNVSSGEGGGTFKAEAGTTLDFASTYTADPGTTITGAGTNLINGSSFTLNNSTVTASNFVFVAGALAFTNGFIGGGSTMTWSGGGIYGTATIASNALLVVNGGGNGNNDIQGALTNAGTIILTNKSYLRSYGDVGGGQLVNLTNGLVNIQDDSYIWNASYASEEVVNQGTIRKSGGTNTSYIAPAFYNSGTLDVQSGTVNLSGNYSLTNGILKFGISSLTNFGQISLSGSPATLAGTLSANLKNGYYPVKGNSFGVLSYGSQAGTFTNFVLPSKQAWSTNYGATVFTLAVLNSAPILPGQTNVTIDELTTLTVTNTATDFDVPSNTLVYSFLAAPAGANISASGIITWTPTEAQGPSTNTFTTRVEDNGSPSLSATNTFTVIVNEVNSAPVLPTLPAQTNVNELATLTVTNTATDSDIPVNPLTYTLLEAPTNAVISTNGVITWTPTQAQSPSTNTITTVVTDTNMYAVNAKSLSATNSFEVIVKEVNVAPVLPIIAQTNVNELALLTVTNTAGESNIHSTITGYGLISPPAGMSINSSGVITWTPSQTESPSTNSITTVVTNSNPYDLVNPHLTATNIFTVIVKEINVAPSLPIIAETNVNELTLLTVTNTATNANIHSTNLSYTLISPPAGMAISANGIITWTPAQTQSPSTNTITTVVTNSNPYDLINPHLTATNIFTVIVKEVNVAPTLPSNIPTQTVNALALLTVTNAATETNIHATLGYALVSPPTNMVISASGVITWTPVRSQGPGTNVITTIVTNTDSFDTVNTHYSATNSFTVIVYAPTLAAIGNYTVNAGQTVAFTASATDNDPTRTLTFSLVSPPGGAAINSASGLFNWRVPAAFANTTNTVQVNVTDNSTPSLSDAKSFTVTVNPLAPVVLTPVSHTNGQFKVQVSGTVGPDYIISASGTLTNWIDLVTNLSPATPFQFTDTNAPSTNRFYRARLSP